MKFKIISFENNVKIKKVFKNIKSYGDSYCIITNNAILNDLLKNELINSSLISDIKLDSSNKEREIYEEAKILQNKYKDIFKNISYRNVKAYVGIEFMLLRQLIPIIKSKKILENKTNTIFVFESFSTSYFSMLKMAEELGYDVKFEIEIIENEQIKILKKENLNFKGNTRNSFNRTLNFVKTSSEEKFSKLQFQIFTKFYKKIFSLIIQILELKIVTLIGKNPEELILKKINKKILKKKKYEENYCFFITAIRKDLYLNPWKPIFEEFSMKNKSFQIITTDLSTSLSLYQEKIPHLNLFEEVNILAKHIRNSSGKKLNNNIESTSSNNQSLIGFDEIYADLMNQLYRSIALIIISDHIFKKIPFKAIIAAADGEMLEKIAINVARNYSIPSFSRLPAAIEPFPIFSDWFSADKIFVDGKNGEDTLIKLGYSKTRIELTGNPKYDNFQKFDKDESKTKLAKNYSVEITKKMIVVAMSRWQKDDEIWLSNLIKFCNKNNLEVIIKLHPRYKTIEHDLSEEKIKEIKIKCKNLKFFISYDYDLYTLLSAADVVITDFSSVGIEAILFDKPLVTVNFSNTNFQNYPNKSAFAKSNASIYVENFNELEKVLLNINNEKLDYEELEEGRQALTYSYNFLNDGKATQRIYKILTKNEEIKKLKK